jgi:hypothetical protein
MCPPGSTPPSDDDDLVSYWEDLRPASGAVRPAPPTATDLRSDPVVVSAIEQAWDDSQPDDPIARHEEGGWIYMDTVTGEIATRRQAAGGQATIDLSNPPVVLGSVVVGKFHTHPNPTAEGWTGGPSLIRADDGIHFSGPDQRRGGLGGGPGFPQ